MLLTSLVAVATPAHSQRIEEQPAVIPSPNAVDETVGLDEPETPPGPQRGLGGVLPPGPAELEAQRDAAPFDTELAENEPRVLTPEAALDALWVQDDPPSAPPAGTVARPPVASVVIQKWIVPQVETFSKSTVTLQNAVVRFCVSRNESAKRALDEAFLTSIHDAAGLVPLAFGSPSLKQLPARVLTDASATAFSRDQIRAIIAGTDVAPRTLSDLRTYEPALMGLSALEQLLLRDGKTVDGGLDNGCDLAVTIAAHLQRQAKDALRVWTERTTLDVHWRDDDAELGDRLILRDLVQGLINGTDLLDRHINRFIVMERDNPELPFGRRRYVVQYLDGLAKSISIQSMILEDYTTSGQAVRTLLQSIRKAIEEGRTTLNSPERRRFSASLRLPFDAVQATVTERLPEVFAFDPTAFERPNAPSAVLREVRTNGATAVEAVPPQSPDVIEVVPPADLTTTMMPSP
ncbi:hypothetical protein L1787_04110 [Acuticoccus sp. M5D2P5]|uniref:imelysin family protein n=1 Tax=Acuticoccus kalidii TaxID=2910977 RepID=UPI001F3DC1E4|nr:imelysin family protein [Acuticoccus kalidii]MCF3932600.1 hypothetical protein [Acuticoccus kalidii]